MEKGCFICRHNPGRPTIDIPCSLYPLQGCQTCKELEILGPQILEYEEELEKLCNRGPELRCLTVAGASFCELHRLEDCQICEDLGAPPMDGHNIEYERILRKLYKKRRDMMTESNENHDRLLGSMPLEIVFSIFSWLRYGWTDDSDSTHPPNKTLLAPFKLGAICRRWRNIAWSQHSLWTFLPVHIDSSRREHSSSPALINEWLDRSASLPLSIQVFAENLGYRKLILPSYKTVINSLNRCSYRWNDFSIDAAPSVISLFRGSSSMPNSSLQRLSLSANIFALDNKRGGRFVLGHNLVSPWKVTIKKFQYIKLGIEWANVMDLTLESQHPKYSLDALRKVSKLKNLTFRGGIDISVEGDNLRTVISHEGVRSLSILAAHCGEPEIPQIGPGMSILYYMSFPNLEAFTYAVDNEESFKAVTHLLSSCPNLTNVSILSAQQMDMFDLKGFLLQHPSIQQLEICFNPHDFLRVLMVKTNMMSEIKQVLPLLQRLRFKWHTFQDTPVDWGLALLLLDNPNWCWLKLIEIEFSSQANCKRRCEEAKDFFANDMDDMLRRTSILIASGKDIKVSFKNSQPISIFRFINT